MNGAQTTTTRKCIECGTTGAYKYYGMRKNYIQCVSCYHKVLEQRRKARGPKRTVYDMWGDL